MAESASATVVLPAGTAPATPPAGAGTPPPAGDAGAPSFAVPKDYAEKPWAKGIDSPDKLWKMMDGAQELIGKRPAGIPGPDATPEELGKFYDAAGRPKTAAEYQFELDPSTKPDDKVVGAIKEIMHKHGLNASQAKGLQKDFDAMTIAMAKEKGIALQQQNADFDKLATSAFGADRDKVLAGAKALLETHTPAAFKGELAKLSNENLVVLAGVLNSISAKYIKADGAPNSHPGGMSATPDTLRAQARELMNSPAYLNSMDPNNAAVRSKVDELYRLATSGK